LPETDGRNTVERRDIERLRDPGFTIARRGYDQRDVDKFLESLVDWLETDAAKELGEVAVTRKLELVGKSTTRILLTAEQESTKLRRAAEQECESLRSDAEVASREIRRAADEYATKVRAEAEESARQTAADARTKAKEIVEEGERRRAEIEAVVNELAARRDHTVEELERLRAQLGSTIGTHTGASPARKGTAKKRDERSEPTEDVDAASVRAKP
jgi:cell division septum initiation protein DivIVA